MGDVLRREATFLDLVLWALDRFPDRVAIVEEDRELTYRHVRDRLSPLSTAPVKLGFGRGNGLMVLSGNQAEALFVSLAVRTLGSWAGALHPLGSADDQAFILEDSEALALVFDPTLYGGAANEIAERVPSLKHVLSLGPSDVAGAQDILALADEETGGAFQSVAEADDLCSLGYSGGTTGRPKGVMQRHRTVVEMTNLICTGWQLPGGRRLRGLTTYL